MTSAFSPTSTKLCVALTGSSVEEQVGQAHAAKARGADLVEIRLDYLDEFEPSTHVAELLQACPLPSIVTCRPVWEGGKYEGTEESRLASLALAVQLHAPFVDVELLAAKPFFAGLDSLPPSPTKVIVSSHNYRCTPPDAELFDVLAAARAAGAAVAKLVTTATTDADAWRMLAALRASVAWGLPTIAFAMGERGQATRLLAGVAGG
ncbi:type I 3-dehydroquinase, partial [Helicosporidium sp. ATCC 50920]